MYVSVHLYIRAFAVTSTPMKDNRTQTKRSMDTWASTKGNTSTVSNQTYMTAYNDTIVSSNLIGKALFNDANCIWIYSTCEYF